MTMMNVTVEQEQRALLVQLELKEATDRMKREGFTYLEITTGVAALANDIVSTQYNQAMASAWFLGMAKMAATLAAQDLPPELKH
ncbi:hypothetical protein [Sphingosinicella sp. LY1275]|uniref:hypothetical protein n=1 Tax=Sphingosinicella sp. LY1275 TaxID=3095379 RepID=UPI002ADEE492|nr:hypothetical protein [Sphingosinicella sp. LY1275]MEA1015595.1 hypothetical protein [Sphingosinicella sp. LY1275]